uniref:Sister chromatid cohesion protein DCC1 n=1 Tax=Evadne anonyx TaxID=141404 RepID=A0A9N6WS03_9CRUS|nr:EOG090X09TV [Evadne anonyx]
MAQTRNLTQVDAMLNLAKLNETDVKNESLILSFIPQIIDSKQVKLLEVSKDMLKYINSGERLYVKGNETENIVVCSNDATFELKEAETSNSLLVMPSLSEATVVEVRDGRKLKSQLVHGIYHTYYELKPMKPKLQTLRRTLARYPYKGKSPETDSDQSIGLSFTELKRVIQASEAELLSQINELHTVKINGKWRLLDIGLLYSWVTYLDSILREKQLPLDEVTAEEVEDWMGLFEIKQVNVKCISMFMEEDRDNLKWNCGAVSRLFALYLLPELRAFDSKDFFAAWEESVPIGVTTCEDHLRGVALVDYDCNPSLVKYLPEFEMPEDVNERLDVLFRTRPKWTLEDISPYIKPLTDGTSNVAALLTKYARSSTVNGCKYYSSKYANHVTK